MVSFSDEDARDFDQLGEIGTLRGGASDYALIWRIVSKAHVSIFDIERNWTFAMMMSFNAFMQMEADYKSGWQEFYKMRRENDR